MFDDRGDGDVADGSSRQGEARSQQNTATEETQARTINPTAIASSAMSNTERSPNRLTSAGVRPPSAAKQMTGRVVNTPATVDDMLRPF